MQAAAFRPAALRPSGSTMQIRAPRPGFAPVVVRQAARSKQGLRVMASAGIAPTPNSNEEGHWLQGSSFSPMMAVPNVTMAGANFGSSGSLGATMERGRLEFVMPTPVQQGPKLDDGGDGGDIGKIIHNGGGGDGGGDDDDDYFNEGDDDGDGEGGEGSASTGFFRAVIPESYDKFSIGAVFAEWMRTVQELPAILRQAVTMGLFSSAQLVRFFSMDVRPSVTRAVSRRLPPTLARDFVGRLMADPGFIQKMVLEASFASAASLWYEYKARGDKFKEELDLVLINTIGMAAATAATVWLLAPSRSYGSLQKLPWQQMLDGLPNCVFDVSGPLRQYTKQARAAGFFAKMAELSAVGAIMGTTTSLLSAAAVAMHKRSNPEWEPSVAVPGVGRSSGGMAAFFALNANTRYQLLGGLDRLLFDRTTYLWTYMLLSGGARLASNQVGELSRAWWQGLPAPSTLTYHTTPQPRRIKKKVSKRVPKPKPQVQQQQQLELGSGELLQAGAVAAAGVAAAAATDASLLADQVASFSSQPAEGAAEPGVAPVSFSSSSVEGAVAESLPSALSAEASLPQASSSSSPVPPALHEGPVEQPTTVHLQLPAAGADSEESSSSTTSPVAPQLLEQQQPEFARH